MKIPKLYHPIVQLLTDAADGAAQFGAAVGLKQNTQPVIAGALTALVGVPAGPNNQPPAVPGLMALWNAAKSDKCAMTAALRSAESNGRALAMAVVDSLRPALGRSWNSAWNAAGFNNHSLAIPDHPLTVLRSLRAYYAAGTAQSNLQKGIDAARNILTGLQTELGQLLDDNDPRWLAFGFDQPGHTGSPDVPQNLTVTAGAAGSHTLYCHCDDSRRADGYRFQLLDPTDPNKVLAELLTQDAEATFDSVASGTKADAVVSARNSTSESQPSARVSVTVP